MANQQYGLRDDQLAVAAVISAQTDYLVSNTVPGAVFEVLLRVTAVVTSLQLVVAVSLDGTNYVTVYTSPAMTGVPRFRRVVFSQSGAASDTDSAAVDAVVNKSPIIEPFIRLRLIPVGGNSTVTMDAAFS